MEFKFEGSRIEFERELSNLDKLVLKFTKILRENNVDYVIISGYVPILFGRSRETEDIDMFIGEMPFERFAVFWSALDKAGFECINAPNPREGYNDYLQQKLALRFALKGRFIPNFELKFPESDLNIYSLKNKIEVVVNGKSLQTSCLELQIAFKLFLGSDKNIEDAIHLWHIFKKQLNQQLFMKFVVRLGVEDRVKELD